MGLEIVGTLNVIMPNGKRLIYSIVCFLLPYGAYSCALANYSNSKRKIKIKTEGIVGGLVMVTL